MTSLPKIVVGFLCGWLCVACGNDSLDSQWPVDPESGLRMDFLQPVPALPQYLADSHSEARESLGRMLYGDPRLSGSGKAACETCHSSMAYFQSSTIFDLPDRSYPHEGPTLHRSAPSLLNVVYAPMFRWDGSHVDSNLSVEENLYEMMVLPFAEANMNTNLLPVEEGEKVDIPSAQVMLKQKLTEEIPEYPSLYEEVFGVDIQHLSAKEIWRLTGKAMATFASVAISRDSAFDRWNAGEDGAVNDAAIRGAILFEGKAGCVFCHNGPLLSDFKFHNISTALPDADGNRSDEGRFIVTGHEKDRGSFLTPMLRGTSMTAPYFHDGSEANLREVIRRKVTDTARLDPNASPLISVAQQLDQDEIHDLVEFLKSLNGKPIPMDKLISFGP